jgi:hypothetical protein
MKKTLAIVTALAISVASFAQTPGENYLFNHWSLGVGFGLTDGLQVTVGTTILPNLQARIQYSDFFTHVAIGNAIMKGQNAPFGINPIEYQITGINYHENGINIDQVDLQGTIQQRDLALLVDFFPSPKSTFHVTGGIMFSLAPNLVSVVGTPKNTTNSDPVMDNQDKGHVRIAGITTDYEGLIHADVKYGLPVKPYLGIGFGRPVNPDGRVSVNFDMGVAFIGGAHLYSYDYSSGSRVPVELNEAWINDPNNAELKANLGDSVNDIVPKLRTANNFPVMPYLRLTVNVRLF